MKQSNTVSASLEPAVSATHHHLLCWKSAFGGLLITIMAYMTLTSLGAGVAGLTAESLINHDETSSALVTGTGVWLGLSAVISLFCGSYFALRISRFVTNKVGAAHGFIIASAFFILMVMASGGTLGNIARNMVVVNVSNQDAARAVADLGWSMFVTFIVGMIAAVIGGRVGAHANVDRPFAARAASQRNDALGYVAPA